MPMESWRLRRAVGPVCGLPSVACASVDLGFVNGKRRRKVIYGKTRKEVADKLKALHRDQAAGLNIAPEQQTVAQYLDRCSGWTSAGGVVHRGTAPRVA